MHRVIFQSIEKKDFHFQDSWLPVRDQAEAEVAMKAAELVLDEPLENHFEVFFADETGKRTHQWDPDSLRWMTHEEKLLKESEDA